MATSFERLSRSSNCAEWLGWSEATPPAHSLGASYGRPQPPVESATECNLALTDLSADGSNVLAAANFGVPGLHQ
jgi:hypothetical protein